MFNLDIQAEAIVQRLETIPDLKTVEYLDEENQSEKFPSKMPAAFVVLEELKAKPKGSLLGASIQWAVILKAKRLVQPVGLAELIDTVIETLHGTNIGEKIRPLYFESVNYFETEIEASAYILRFSGDIPGVRWKSCNE